MELATPPGKTPGPVVFSMSFRGDDIVRDLNNSNSMTIIGAYLGVQTIIYMDSICYLNLCIQYHVFLGVQTIICMPLARSLALMTLKYQSGRQQNGRLLAPGPNTKSIYCTTLEYCIYIYIYISYSFI